MTTLRALRAWAGRIGPDACLVALRLMGWLAVTLLATLGCLMLVFLMLGDFSAEGFFAQLDNISRRFLEADPDRREQFLSLAATLAGILVAGMAAFRRHSLAAVFRLFPKDSTHV